jgi:hypothetical protein
MREDFTRIGADLLYGWIPGEASKLFRHRLMLNTKTFLNNDGYTVQSIEVSPGWQMVTKSMWQATIMPTAFYESVSDSFSLSENADIPPGEYRFYSLQFMGATPMGSRAYSMLLFNIGSFYDGWLASISVMPTWSISNDFELSGFYQFNRADFSERHQSMLAHIGRLKALWTISTSFSISAYVQYNSLAHVTVGNIRFRYNPREGNDFYLVYDEVINDDLERDIPFLPRTAGRTLLLKYSYTFNF